LSALKLHIFALTFMNLHNPFLRKFPLVIYFLFTSFLFSCNNGKNAASTISDVFIKDYLNTNFLNSAIVEWANGKIKQLPNNNLDSVSKKIITDAITTMYTLHGKTSIWVTAKGVTSDSKKLLESLLELQKHGIQLESYNFVQLKNWQAQIMDGSAADSIIHQFELGMSYAFTKSVADMQLGNIAKNEIEYFNRNDTNFSIANYCYSKLQSDSLRYLYQPLIPSLKLYTSLLNKLELLTQIKNKGGWPIISGLKDSFATNASGEKITLLRKRLFAEINLPLDTLSNIYSEDLNFAIKQFQYLHDIKVTGIIDTSTLKRLKLSVDNKINWINTNLERIRKLNQHFPQPYIWVNVPQMQLQYIRNDSVMYRMRTVVGRTGRPTPTLDAAMTNIVINPNWSVPATIMKEEIIPGISRRGGDYLTRRGLTAYLGSKKIDPRVINEKNFKRYRIEQKPGLNSSLGAVKFNLPNVHSIYLHDTPHREDFVKYYRAYSSGCIRVEKPRDFAVFLLADTNYTKPKVDSIIKNKDTRVVNLKQKLDVHIVYVTNDLDSVGNLLYLRDIYNKDKI
jgi:L,D-transpeptidase YcbB